jgi:hypothetical protein
VREIAMRDTRRITLLHVLTERGEAGEARSLAEARLERLREDLQKRAAQDVRVDWSRDWSDKKLSPGQGSPSFSSW